MSRDGHKEPARLADGGGTEPLSRLLSAVGEAEPPLGLEEAVWRKVLEARRPRPRRWLWAALAVPALASLALVLAWPSNREEPVAVLALASGEVRLLRPESGWSEATVGERLAAGSRLSTARESRALLRIGGTVALLEENGRASVQRGSGGLAVLLEEGEVAVLDRHPGTTLALLVSAGDYAVEAEGTFYSVKVAADRAVAVRVHEGVVRVRGPSTDVRLRGGEAWVSAGQAAFRTGQRERALAMSVSSVETDESSLRIEGEPDFEVEVDGVFVGRPPVRMLVETGKRSVIGRRERAEVRGEATVDWGRVAVYRLQPPELPAPEVGSWQPSKGKTVAAAAPAGRAATGISPPLPAAAPVDRSTTFDIAPGAPPAVRSQPGNADTPEIPRRTPPADPLESLEARLASAAPEEREELSYQLATALTRRGRYGEAVRLYESLARGGGRHAELSAYEVGRLKKRYLGDRAGAVAAFADYRARFPRGALRPEVDLSLIEAHLEAGSFSAALAEMDSFLATHPSSERRGEVLLLRANVLRERGEHERALADYLELVEVPGTLGDDASYFAASCERATGRLEAARARLEHYLSRYPTGRHRLEAERNLGAAR
ncbi:MAG: tetratricopeptide repeat protein [Myxococcales bacterium]|nr:tetratricopeptide repeat protein [Myxococcales bacterium]